MRLVLYDYSSLKSCVANSKNAYYIQTHTHTGIYNVFVCGFVTGVARQYHYTQSPKRTLGPPVWRARGATFKNAASSPPTPGARAVAARR